MGAGRGGQGAGAGVSAAEGGAAGEPKVRRKKADGARVLMPQAFAIYRSRYWFHQVYPHAYT